MAARAAGRRSAAKRGAGEVEEVRHREGVVADVAVGEEVADVGDEGEMAGAPEAVAEGDGDTAKPMSMKATWAKVIQRREDLSVAKVLSAWARAAAMQYQKREVGGEGVVLLVGGDGEEDQDERGVEGEEEGGALLEGGGPE